MNRFFVMFLAALAVAPVAVEAQTASGTSSSVAASRNSLLPGDVVEVQIWREEDLSGEFTVDEDGIVVLPLIGEKSVSGISPQDLRDQLSEDYAVYLQNPSVNVRLLRRITVAGEVRVPGLYTVDATVSLADLIARAGGLTSDGDSDKVTLTRGGQLYSLDLNGATVVGEAGIRSGDRLLVGRRSWLSRNFSSVVGIVSIISNIALIASR